MISLKNKTVSRNHIILLLICILSTFPVVLTGQGEKKFIRQGNREYEKDRFSESEISYRRALDKNKTFPDAVFNIGDALYKQKKYEEAVKQFEGNSAMNDDHDKKSSALYNLGNSLLMGGKIEESIEAYKNSLRLKPENPEAKYNLAYAQDLLRKQEEQQSKDQNKQDNKEQNQDQQNDKDKGNDKNKQKQQDENNNQQQQQQQQGISKEDAERLLNSIANDEKNVQEKVKLAKAANARVKTLKNW
jgi:tetratricopeptide (TPR) repeat protein